MANHPIRMSLLKQIIVLKQKGLSHRRISAQLGISRKTTSKYVRLWQQKGEPNLEEASFSSPLLSPYCEPTNEENPRTRLYAFFPHVEKELQRTGVTRLLLWKEYQREDTPRISYARFCIHFRRWQQEQQVTMHLEHKAGDKLMVDFTGKKLSVVDPIDGEVTSGEVFVAILAASQYTYVEAVADQTLGSFLKALQNALYFFGGIPQAIVPDNLKAAVTKANRHEPLLNQTIEEFAYYHSTVIVPTRPYKPRDKALVEGAVKIIYSRIFAPLRDQVFTSIRGLNQAIRLLLEDYNNLPFKGRQQSRKERFVAIEQPVLQPLPSQRYEYRKHVKATVYKSAHVWLGEDQHFYSVPYQYVSKRVRISYTATVVEVYYQHQRIALHTRTLERYGYTTRTEHLPAAHRFVADWHPEKFLVWAEEIGSHTRQLVEHILNGKPHPQQAYNTATGFFSLARKVGDQRLEKACARALHYHSHSYRTVKNILDKALEELDDVQPETATQCFTIEHENLRGNRYYQ